MSLPLIRKPFIVQGLAFTIAVFMMNNAQAASEQEQIQQLRDEVKELRALLEQYVPQSKQKNNVPQYDTQRSTTVVSVSTQNISSNTQMAAQKSPLSFNSASGAQVQLYGFLRGDASYQAKGGDSKNVTIRIKMAANDHTIDSVEANKIIENISSSVVSAANATIV